MDRIFSVLGALAAALAVAAGAFGAHALRARVEPRMLEVFETAARYQMYHALGLFAVAWVISRAVQATAIGAGAMAGAMTGSMAAPGATFAVVAGWLFVAGTLLFSGSLYAMTLTGVRALGAITPIGGVCFIAGWVCLGIAAMRA
jgi:uncharacterized membrane protein YgdD (TMEM256/DUF423 family)